MGVGRYVFSGAGSAASHQGLDAPAYARLRRGQAEARRAKADRPDARKNGAPAVAHDAAPARVIRRPVRDRLDNQVGPAPGTKATPPPMGTPARRFSTWGLALAASRRAPEMTLPNHLAGLITAWGARALMRRRHVGVAARCGQGAAQLEKHTGGGPCRGRRDSPPTSQFTPPPTLILANRPDHPSERGHREPRAAGAFFRPSGRGAAAPTWLWRFRPGNQIHWALGVSVSPS